MAQRLIIVVVQVMRLLLLLLLVQLLHHLVAHCGRCVMGSSRWVVVVVRS